MGHTNRPRRRRQIKKKSSRTNPVESADVTTGDPISPANSEDPVSTQTKKTRSGRQIRQPLRFRDQDCPMASSSNRGKL